MSHVAVVRVVLNSVIMRAVLINVILPAVVVRVVLSVLHNSHTHKHTHGSVVRLGLRYCKAVVVHVCMCARGC